MFKAQAMSVFKLMIAAVIAVALLTIVTIFLSSTKCQYNGIEELKNLIIQAVNAPGECLERNAICFDNGDIFREEAFANSIPNLDSISFDEENDNLNIECSSSECSFSETVKLPVKVICDINSCEVYFNSRCSN